MTEQLHFHFSLSCTGEGNGNPLQCSCLENPRDGGAWWAVVYGVALSRTRLKRLSSSRQTDQWKTTENPDPEGSPQVTAITHGIEGCKGESGHTYISFFFFLSRK